MTGSDRRIMRVPLPISLIREIDAVILQGLGGYSTRAEFIIDAIQERVLELTIDTEEDAGPPPALKSLGATAVPSSKTVESHGVASEGSPTRDDGRLTVEATRLADVPVGYLLEPGDCLNSTRDAEMFGLHNRDFPSLWVLQNLASATRKAPIRIDDFYRRVLMEAWDFGAMLLRLTDGSGKKHAALFPTNKAKLKAAEEAFKSFAIGEHRVSKDGSVTTTGPLFVWKAAGVTARSGELVLGVTPAGWNLLRSCAGIDVSQPHPSTAADAFLEHLTKHAPRDWAAFAAVTASVGEAGAQRSELLERLRAAGFEWSESELSTNASGYVARCREWGLLEPKQANGRYQLTRYGRDFLDGLNQGTST